MANSAFDDIAAGLQDAIAFANGNDEGAEVHQVHGVDVAALRAPPRVDPGRVYDPIRCQHRYSTQLGARSQGSTRTGSCLPTSDRTRA